MKNTWAKFERAVVKSHLRVPIYILTIISGCLSFMSPSFMMVNLFLFLLGSLILLESVHPFGYEMTLLKPLLPHLINKNMKRMIILSLKTLFIILGMFIMGLSILVYFGNR